MNQGDRVSSGELLAKIDDSTLRAQLAQVEAQIAQASAQAQVVRAQRSDHAVNQTTQAGRVRESSAGQRATARTIKTRTLYKQGYVSQSQFEQSRAAYVAAQTQYQTAIANQGNTGVQGANAAAARQAVARSASTSEHAAHGDRANVAVLTVQRRRNGASTWIRARWCSRGPKCCRFRQFDTVWVNVNVPDDDLAYVRSGTPVRLPPRNWDRARFAERFTQSTPCRRKARSPIKPASVSRIRTTSLRGGMLITRNDRKGAPQQRDRRAAAAVAQTDQGSNVFIVGSDHKADEVPVTVGLQTDTLSEVISPHIQPGNAGHNDAS